MEKPDPSVVLDVKTGHANGTLSNQCMPQQATGERTGLLYLAVYFNRIQGLKLAFHDADILARIFAGVSGESARILARKSVLVLVSASWNTSFRPHGKHIPYHRFSLLFINLLTYLLT